MIPKVSSRRSKGDMQNTRIIAFAVGLALAAQFARADDCLSIVDNLPGTFLDISTTGTILPLSGEQVTTLATTVSNVVFPSGTLYVGNNGGIGFGISDPNTATLDPNNQPLPSTAAFNNQQALLGFWDDIGNTVGHVYAQEFSNELVVQWDKKPFDTLVGNSITFEIRIFRDAQCGDILAQFIYYDVEDPRPDQGSSATIGYQDGGAGFNDYQWSFNSFGAVQDGTVLSLVCCTPEPGTSLMLLLLIPAFRRR